MGRGAHTCSRQYRASCSRAASLPAGAICGEEKTNELSLRCARLAHIAGLFVAEVPSIHAHGAASASSEQPPPGRLPTAAGSAASARSSARLGGAAAAASLQVAGVKGVQSVSLQQQRLSRQEETVTDAQQVTITKARPPTQTTGCSPTMLLACLQRLGHARPAVWVAEHPLLPQVLGTLRHKKAGNNNVACHWNRVAQQDVRQPGWCSSYCSNGAGCADAADHITAGRQQVRTSEASRVAASPATRRQSCVATEWRSRKTRLARCWKRVCRGGGNGPRGKWGKKHSRCDLGICHK